MSGILRLRKRQTAGFRPMRKTGPSLRISQSDPIASGTPPARYCSDGGRAPCLHAPCEPWYRLSSRGRGPPVTNRRRRAIILRLGGVVLFGRCGWPTAGKHAVFRTRHIHQITSESLQSNRRLTAHTYPDPLPLPGHYLLTLAVQTSPRFGGNYANCQAPCFSDPRRVRPSPD
jgi:hypothetical protein